MKRTLLALMTLLACSLPAVAQPVYEPGNNTLPSNMTSVTGNVPSSATTVTLTASSRHLIIKTDPAAAVLYVSFSGNATTSNFRIEPGSALSIDGPALPSISILGASATGTYSVCAW